MPKKGKGRRQPEYHLVNHACFQGLIDAGKKPQLERKTFLGFKLRNVNQLWRWDTLEDISL